MYATQAGMKLVDSRRQGQGVELFVVEGESAARSVANLRKERNQAVLPLQGKPLNAWKASRSRVLACPLYRQLAAALGLPDAATCDDGHLRTLRYERVLLLFDPDADGVHVTALVLLYFKRWLPALLGAGRIHVVRAPMFALEDPMGRVETCYANSRAHAEDLSRAMRDAGAADVHRHAFLGLGSISPPLLARCCVDPATRASRVAGEADVAAVLQAFAALGA